MKNRYWKRRRLKHLLMVATECTLQYTGWSCNTCFHALDLGISNDRLHELWQSTLLIRGDYNDLIQQNDEVLTENVNELIKLLEDWYDQ